MNDTSSSPLESKLPQSLNGLPASFYHPLGLSTNQSPRLFDEISLDAQQHHPISQQTASARIHEARRRTQTMSSAFDAPALVLVDNAPMARQERTRANSASVATKSASHWGSIENAGLGWSSNVRNPSPVQQSRLASHFSASPMRTDLQVSQQESSDNMAAEMSFHLLNLDSTSVDDLLAASPAYARSSPFRKPAPVGPAYATSNGNGYVQGTPNSAALLRNTPMTSTPPPNRGAPPPGLPPKMYTTPTRTPLRSASPTFDKAPEFYHSQSSPVRANPATDYFPAPATPLRSNEPASDFYPQTTPQRVSYTKPPVYPAADQYQAPTAQKPRSNTVTQYSEKQQQSVFNTPNRPRSMTYQYGTTSVDPGLFINTAATPVFRAVGSATSPLDYYPSDSPTFSAAEALWDSQNQQHSLGETQMPSRTLWIGNLDPALEADNLHATFSRFGPIDSIRMFTDRECAFINYVNIEDSLAAWECMQGERLGNTIVRVGFGKADVGIQDSQTPTKSLWVGGIHPMTRPADLEAVFSPYGRVESARVLSHKCCGFINFVRVRDAVAARDALNGYEFAGSQLKIKFAKEPSKTDPSTLMMPPPESPTAVHSSPEPLSPWAQSSLSAPPFSPRPPANIKPGKTTAAVVIRSPETPAATPVPKLQDSTSVRVTVYATCIPPVPAQSPSRKIDPNRLREIRKKLEGSCTPRDVEQIFHETIGEAVDLCADYIGNVVIQKLAEKCNDAHRQRLIETVASNLAAFGVHKNGTWAVQKIIDCAKTAGQIDAIVDGLRAYTPPLLMDQFGNYVVQCCLRLGSDKSQFVFDAICAKMWDLGQGRFSARAMRACLESQYTTPAQQTGTSKVILEHAVALATNANGSLLLTWLLDSSPMPGKFLAAAHVFAPHVATVFTNKSGSGTLMKIAMQRTDPEARSVLVQALCASSLGSILDDTNNAVPNLQKLLQPASALTPADRQRLATSLRAVADAGGYDSVAHRALWTEVNRKSSASPSRASS